MSIIKCYDDSRYTNEVIDGILEFVNNLSFEDARTLIHNHIPREERVLMPDSSDSTSDSAESSPIIYNMTNPPHTLRKSSQALKNNYPHLNLIDLRINPIARIENEGPLGYKTLSFCILPEAFVYTTDENGENIESVDIKFKANLKQRIEQLISENRPVEESPSPVPAEPEGPLDPIQIAYFDAMQFLDENNIDYREIIIEWVEENSDM